MEHNNSIACTVKECKHHCKHDNYCTLDQIQVVKNEHCATDIESTDCSNFRAE